MTAGPLYRVFDTGPLSAFANADVLGVLKLLSVDYHCILVEPVAQELQAGSPGFPKLRHALDTDWLDRRDLASTDEVARFAEIGQRLIGRSGRNTGETAVIAWALAHPGAQVVLDDGDARRVARRFQLDVTGSVGLLIDAIKAGHLGQALALGIADELLANGRARLPFKVGGFIDWAKVEGLI